MAHSKQEETWSGAFGKEYTDRNTMTIDELNKLYENSYGSSREKMNSDFVGKLDRNIKI